MKKLFTMCLMLCCVMVAVALDFTLITAEGYELKYSVTDAGVKTVECRGLVDKSTAGAADLVIPDSVKYNDIWYKVTSIGYQAFYECFGFTGGLIIGAGVTNIGDWAWGRCDGFRGRLTIPVGVESIGDGAFYGCTGFTGSLTIPDGVGSIESSAFSGCYGFTGSLTIGDGVEYIGDGAFSYCSGFSGSLTIPDGVMSIGGNAFSGCFGFTGSLVIGDAVTSIGEEALLGCYGFTGSLVIGDGVTSIKIRRSAFSGCSGFTGSLVIGDGVTSIGGSAFDGCSGFTGSLTIGDGVEYIGSWAFSYCSGFSGSLTIGDAVKWIWDNAFAECEGLTSVTNKAVVPQKVSHDDNSSSSFGGVSIDKIPLYVPEGSIDAYKAAAVWKDFMSIEALDDDTALGDVAQEMSFVQQGHVLTFAQPAFVNIFTVNGQLVRSGIMEQCVLPAESGVYVMQAEMKDGTLKAQKIMVND